MARGGSKPGEHRGGRRKGVKNKTTIVLAETGKTLAEMAREHSPRALEILRDIAENGESEAARIAAVNALLDRGYGRPPQAPPLKEEDEPFNVESIDLREFSKLVLFLLDKAARLERKQEQMQRQIDGTMVKE